MASRRTQPYRKAGGRTPGGALSAMVRGKPFFMANPQDAKREAERKGRRRRRGAK